MKIALAAAALVALVACGADDPVATPSPGSTTAAVGSVSRFCGEMARYQSVALQPNATKAELARGVELAKTAITAARTYAPADIRPSVVVVADAFVPFAAELARVGYDYNRLPSGASAKLGTAEVRAALKRMSTYRGANCH